MVVLNFLKNIILFIPNGIIQINNFAGRVSGLTETASRTATVVTKIIGISVGSAVLAKGSVDLIESITIQNEVCTLFSIIGVCADGLFITVSFVPGTNVTGVITAPVSIFCKVFVFCYKRRRT